MDPNATLAAIRDAVQAGDNDALTEHWRALDDWLARGGFDPAAEPPEVLRYMARHTAAHEIGDDCHPDICRDVNAFHAKLAADIEASFRRPPEQTS
jgi:hypothetical protein